MHCPKCEDRTLVTDSRNVDDANVKRRRRECQNCGYRFSTFESVLTEGPVYDKGHSDGVDSALTGEL